MTFVKVRTRQNIWTGSNNYDELSLSKSSTINCFLSIVAILTLAICSTALLALIFCLSQLVAFLNLLVSIPIVTQLSCTIEQVRFTISRLQFLDTLRKRKHATYIINYDFVCTVALYLLEKGSMIIPIATMRRFLAMQQH